MLFEAKKLELESAEELFQCPITSVKPFSLMLSPVYILLERNQKFVSVKSPLDFFTPDELASLGSHGEFYFPRSISEVTRFQTAGRVTRELIRAARSDFPPAPYEISNQILITLAPLWGEEVRVSPFCAAIFADELCGHLSSQELLLGRESAVVRHDLGLLLSGFLAFTLVHLGWYDLEWITNIRTEVYSRTIRGEEWLTPTTQWEMITGDLQKLIDLGVPLGSEGLRELSSQWVFELNGRLKRIRDFGKVLQERGTHPGRGGFTW